MMKFLPFWVVVLTLSEAIGQQKKPYTEDLTKLRPPVGAPMVSRPVAREKIVASNSVNESVNTVLDSIAAFNLSLKYADGFRVQVYSGQKKQEALEAAGKVNDLSTELKADVEFVQPKFRVVVGKYYSRLEAYRDLYRLRRIFPGAIIVPEKVNFVK